MNSIQSETWTKVVSGTEEDRIQMASTVQSIHQWIQTEGLEQSGLFTKRSQFEYDVLFVVMKH